MSTTDNPSEEQDKEVLRTAAAQPVPIPPATNSWGRQGRVAQQTSHTLSAPLGRVTPDRIQSEIGDGVGAVSESPPEFTVPESVVHARPPQRLPEDAFCRSPIAGLVVEVAICAGQQIKRRQPALIIEAMKMQNYISAEVDGVVKAIHVRGRGASRTNPFRTRLTRCGYRQRPPNELRLRGGDHVRIVLFGDALRSPRSAQTRW